MSERTVCISAPTQSDTPLNSAVRDGQVEKVRELLRTGIDVNAVSEFGDAHLYVAVDMGHVEIAEILLNARADINTTSRFGIKLLPTAARAGRIAMAKILLNAGAEINAASTGAYYDTPLREAALNSHKEMVELLLKAGANVKLTNKNKVGQCEKALLDAAYEGKKEIVELMIKIGVDVNFANEHGGQPLSYAASQGHLGIVELLLEAGANINPCHESGYPPLYRAASGGHKETAKLLINSGADINPDNFRPLFSAVCEDQLTMVELLLEIGAEVNAADESGYTVLYKAAIKGNKHIVKKLVEFGADIPSQLKLAEINQNLPAEMFDFLANFTTRKAKRAVID